LAIPPDYQQRTEGATQGRLWAERVVVVVVVDLNGDLDGDGDLDRDAIP
jgi:hypothetical protein